MLFNRVENFHNKITFYSSYKKFWIVENYFRIIEKRKTINTRKLEKGLKDFHL